MKKLFDYIARKVWNEIGSDLTEGIATETSLKAVYAILSEDFGEEFAEQYIKSLLEAKGVDGDEPTPGDEKELENEKWGMMTQGEKDAYKEKKKSQEELDEAKGGVQSVLNSKVTNPDTGRQIKVSSGLSYDNNTGGYQAAKSKMKDAGVSDDEIEKAASSSDDSDSGSEKSSKMTDNVYGVAGEGDTDVKNNMFKYGFADYQKGTGNRPAPGSAGSAFNEIASGEGVHMLGETPKMSENELARKMYEQYKETALGKEQSKSSGVGKIPKDIDNPKLYSKCVIAARSAKTKYDTTQNRVKSLQDSGKFGKVDKIDTYYGAADSIQAQVDAINGANTVLLPNGTEVSKEDAVKFVKAGGGGMNPSDTATFVKDGDGNLLIQYHSDKTSTADIQDNSTLAQEGENYKSSIDAISGLSDEEKAKAKSIVDEYSSKMSKIEENYNNQTSKIANRLSELPIDDQISIIENDKGTLKKNIEVALFGKDGKPKSQFKDYLPKDATTDSLSMEEKYEAVRKLVTDGNGKANEIKVITKVGLAIQSKDPSINGIDVKELISSEREQVVNLQRERVKELNSQSVDVDGVDVPLGRLMEAEETIRGFHLTLMDYPPKDYKEGDPSSMVGSTLDVNMGGTQVNGDVLRSCMGVGSSTEFKQKFKLNEVDKIMTDDNGNVTGKTVFVYAIDSEGNQIEIGQKTYRSKAGATGKTNNTFTYSSDMQNCFKSK
jgi:hypothetical protein